VTALFICPRLLELNVERWVKCPVHPDRGND
jgi:hypothetical protein